jgi:GMP synthase (glutamine-hydrolysing)
LREHWLKHASTDCKVLVSDALAVQTGAMTRPVLILQHVPWEKPALLGDALSAAGIDWARRIVLDSHNATDLPPLESLSGIAILGGPMGALDVDEHPGLALEASFVRAAVDGDVPLLGICLGHQIVATALGAALHTGGAPEFGIGEVDVLVDDPVFGVAGTTQPVLHWHRDAVDAPAGATVLASTPGTPNQAFRIGTTVFATQFHLEVDRALLGEWLTIPAMSNDLDAGLRATMEQDFASAESGLRTLAATAFGQFADAARNRG